MVEVIRLTKRFLDREFTDITSITDFEGEYISILTVEEIHKLKIYKQSSDDLRHEIEKAFWSAEDFYFCNGSIWLILGCIDYAQSDDYSRFDSQKLSEFKSCSECFKILFEDQIDDWVRRALLTKGDYLMDHGCSTILNKSRLKFSFIFKHEKWQKRLSSENVDIIMPYKELIKDFEKRWTEDTTEDTTIKRRTVLEQIIDCSQITEEDWRYYFIKKCEPLKRCGRKMICEEDEGGDWRTIVLLKTNKVRKDSDWEYLGKVIENCD